jgi:hypothetical protein
VLLPALLKPALLYISNQINSKHNNKLFMRKADAVYYFVLFMLFTGPAIQTARGASQSNLVSNPSAAMHPPSKEMLQVAKMRWFASLSLDQYSKVRGKKLNFMERLSFHLSQNRMKKMLKHYDYGEVTTLQKISWLLKGLLLGPIAVLLAYIFAGEDEREIITWAWIGFAGFAVILTIILLSL